MQMIWTACVGIVMFGALGACSDDDGGEPNIDVEGCEHLQEGPFVNITASAARDAAAPAVAVNHTAYTTALTAGAVGYVSFAATEAIDYIVFLDKPVPFEVFDTNGAKIALEGSATSSPECETIKGKHTFPLGVGTAYFALGPNMGMPVNVVVEEAAGHAE